MGNRPKTMRIGENRNCTACSASCSTMVGLCSDNFRAKEIDCLRGSTVTRLTKLALRANSGKASGALVLISAGRELSVTRADLRCASRDSFRDFVMDKRLLGPKASICSAIGALGGVVAEMRREIGNTKADSVPLLSRGSNCVSVTALGLNWRVLAALKRS